MENVVALDLHHNLNNALDHHGFISLNSLANGKTFPRSHIKLPTVRFTFDYIAAEYPLS